MKSFQSIQSFLFEIILLLQVALLPFVVRLQILPVPDEITDYWFSAENWDFFSFYKIWIAIVFSALILYWQSRKSHLLVLKQLKPEVYLVILFASLTIASALFSSYSHTAWFGFPDRQEGALAWLAYLVFFLSACVMGIDERFVRRWVLVLGISATLMGMIGILQFLNHDPFKTQLGLSLVVPSAYGEILDRIGHGVDTRLANAKAIYGTLYNPNTLGHYMSFMFPFFFVWFIGVKGLRKRSILGLISGLLLFNVIGSFSRGSLVGVVIGLLVSGAVFWRFYIARWKLLLMIAASGLILLIGMNVYSNNTLLSKFMSLTSTDTINMDTQTRNEIRSFSFGKHSLTLYTADVAITLHSKNRQLSATDRAGHVLKLDIGKEPMTYVIKKEGYERFVLKVKTGGFEVTTGKIILPFQINDDAFYYINMNGKIQTTFDVKKFGFEGAELFASGRGYIWSRTIPLLKNHLLLGSGPDTFATEFPQQDVMGKLQLQYNPNLIIDKAHNMYLQLAVTHGVVALLAFLALIVAYFIRTVRSVSQLDSTHKLFSIAIFTGILSYCITGLFTDTTVSVSLIFWIFLGLGMRISLKERVV
jgi:hypothetical protein